MHAALHCSENRVCSKSPVPQGKAVLKVPCDVGEWGQPAGADCVKGMSSVEGEWRGEGGKSEGGGVRGRRLGFRSVCV